jgi:hypothetical protein
MTSCLSLGIVNPRGENSTCSLEKILNTKVFVSDMFYLRAVVFMDGFHNEPHRIRRFAAQIREEDWKFIPRPVYPVSGMKKIP